MGKHFDDNKYEQNMLDSLYVNIML